MFSIGRYNADKKYPKWKYLLQLQFGNEIMLYSNFDVGFAGTLEVV